MCRIKTELYEFHKFENIIVGIYKLYINKNNPKPYMISENERYKMAALLKSIKNT